MYIVLAECVCLNASASQISTGQVVQELLQPFVVALERGGGGWVSVMFL